VGEYPSLRSAAGEVFPLHESVIGRRSAERYSISIVVAAHADETGTPADPAFKMINVGRFQLRSGWLVMAAVFVQPWNWIRLSVTVVRP
jgi:hypothetical protein